MRSLVIGLVAVGVMFGPSSFAQPAGANVTCSAQLESLAAEWDRIGFAAPSKPGQQLVVGRHGHVSSGPEVAYIRGQIGLAARACREGRQQEATMQIEKARALLDRTGPRAKATRGSAPMSGGGLERPAAGRL